MNTHKELLSECCSAKPLDELAYDNSGRCGDCKEGCMFVAGCETSCGINADPADGFGRCTCGNERLEPTPPSQIEEEFLDEVLDKLEAEATHSDSNAWITESSKQEAKQAILQHFQQEQERFTIYKSRTVGKSRLYTEVEVDRLIRELVERAEPERKGSTKTMEDLGLDDGDIGVHIVRSSVRCYNHALDDYKDNLLKELDSLSKQKEGSKDA